MLPIVAALIVLIALIGGGIGLAMSGVLDGVLGGGGDTTNADAPEELTTAGPPEDVVTTEDLTTENPSEDLGTGRALAVGDTLRDFGGYDWRVLAIADDRALVITEDIIDLRAYNEQHAEVSWETCTLRQWLNDDFYRTAFSDAEQTMILETTVQNPDNLEYFIPGGNDTVDRIFLLSIDELDQYFPYQPDRIAQYQGSDHPWWLRSLGSSTRYAAEVGSDGHISPAGRAVEMRAAVRPALWISL
jgi:hypothetical protein